MYKIEIIKARECTVDIAGMPVDIGPERMINPQSIYSLKHVYNDGHNGYYIIEAGRPVKTYFVPESEDGPLIETIVERHRLKTALD